MSSEAPARPAAPMSAEMIARKLALIRQLTLPEIPGWYAGHAFRAPFDGEIAALKAREKELRDAR